MEKIQNNIEEKNDNIINNSKNNEIEGTNKEEDKNINENIVSENKELNLDKNDSKFPPSKRHSCLSPNLNKNKLISEFKKRGSQCNPDYLNRFIDYEKKKEQKITEMKKEKDEKEKKELKKKPNISRRSVELMSGIKIDFFERMKEEEKKTKEKKEKLIEKINNERAKKKEEIEKPMDYNIKPTKMDKKFNKILENMIKKDEDLKEKLGNFSEAIKEYEMRECVFQPNINKNEEGNDNKKGKKRISSCEIVKRLYNDELKNRVNEKEKLEQKYKLTFKPNISGKSIELANKRKEKKNKAKNLEINNNNNNKPNNKKKVNTSMDEQVKKKRIFKNL